MKRSSEFKKPTDVTCSAAVRPIRIVAILGFAVWVASRVAIFSAGGGSHNYTIAATDPGFGERGFVRGSGGKAEAFSLIYTLILDFFEHVI